MDTASVYELIGYVASALIVLSLLMSSVLKLRVINLVGAAVFTTYGSLIGSLPVVLANGAIVLIDVYYLAAMWRARADSTYFEIVEERVDSPLVRRFVELHLDDMRRSVPGFAGLADDHLVWVVLRDAVPAGVVLARLEGARAHLDLDYVVPAHRDLRAGSYLYRDAEVFRRHGITEVTADAGAPGHRQYLERMGFEGEGARLHRAVG